MAKVTLNLLQSFVDCSIETVSGAEVRFRIISTSILYHFFLHLPFSQGLLNFMLVILRGVAVTNGGTYNITGYKYF